MNKKPIEQMSREEKLKEIRETKISLIANAKVPDHIREILINNDLSLVGFAPKHDGIK